MFVHQNRLPHVLPPRLYVCPEQYELELRNLFRPGWHVVASIEELVKDGDFITVELLGVPLLVRNFAGDIHAYLNVCTHRHCLLSHQPRGNSTKLVCQYHGWEYCADGSTGRIPDAGSFRPLPGGPEQLKQFQVRTRGPLVFVTLAETPMLFEEEISLVTEPLDEYRGRWQLSKSWFYDMNVNWKVAVENTIESYHVPVVHPKTLVKYTAEESTIHEISRTGVVMRSLSVTPAFFWWLARLVLPWLEPGLTIDKYRLFHSFPHLFVIRIDATLQVMTVFPLSPVASRLIVRVFALRAAKESWISRGCTWFWGRLKTAIVRLILAEDLRLLPDIQQGMSHSPFQGTISAREELVFAFQDYVHRKCALPTGEVTESNSEPTSSSSPDH